MKGNQSKTGQLSDITNYPSYYKSRPYCSSRIGNPLKASSAEAANKDIGYIPVAKIEVIMIMPLYASDANPP